MPTPDSISILSLTQYFSVSILKQKIQTPIRENNHLGSGCSGGAGSAPRQSGMRKDKPLRRYSIKDVRYKKRGVRYDYDRWRRPSCRGAPQSGHPPHLLGLRSGNGDNLPLLRKDRHRRYSHPTRECCGVYGGRHGTSDRTSRGLLWSPMAWA